MGIFYNKFIKISYASPVQWRSTLASHLDERNVRISSGWGGSCLKDATKNYRTLCLKSFKFRRSESKHHWKTDKQCGHAPARGIFDYESSAFKSTPKRRNLSHRHTWRFYTPIAANLIASENRKRFSLAIDADTPGDFFADRGDVAVLKTHVTKSPNLMGWLHWRFTAINIENRGNGHTWRIPANLIADIWHARYRRFYTPIAAIGENRNRCTGHTWRFSSIAAIGV